MRTRLFLALFLSCYCVASYATQSSINLVHNGGFEEDGGWPFIPSGADAKSVEALSTAAKAQGMPFTVVEDSFDGDRTNYGARLILVRPDQHIAWAGDDAPADAAALMRKVTGS